MKPIVHAKNSARKHGGKPEDYIDIHNFMDCSKMCHPDMRHRAILHNSLGPFIAERIFGIDFDLFDSLCEKFGWTEEEQAAIVDLLNKSRTDSATCIKNSDGKSIAVRTIAEEHVLEDMGKIPTVSDYLNELPMLELIGHRRPEVKTLKVRLEDLEYEEQK